MSLVDRVRETVAATLNVPVSTIAYTTADADMAAWDSLGHVNLMMALEQSFNIQLEVEDFPKLNSVAAIVEYLEAQQIS